MTGALEEFLRQQEEIQRFKRRILDIRTATRIRNERVFRFMNAELPINTVLDKDLPHTGKNN